MLDDEIEERVDGMLAARVRDLAERLAHEARVWARDDERVVEVALPHARRAFALVVLAEAAAVRGILHQRVALASRSARCKQRLARAELFEDDEIDAVGVDLERHRQRLPAKVSRRRGGSRAA